MSQNIEPEYLDPRHLVAGRYRLDRQIARGGMAEVWLGVDTFLNRQVAVKVLKPQLADDPIVAERFRREAVACAGISHPNIVAVYDSVEHNGRLAVVMQYIQGKSLREILDRKNRLAPLLTIHLGAAIAAALDTTHKAGLIHRDVKPGNILITPEARFLLADFGIAKALAVSGDDLTNDNIMMGTAKYLSPEQVRGKPLDGRADLYGLGLVLYECLAGKVPFIGESDADTALARLQREPTDLAHLRPSLAPQLVRVIHKLLSRNPDHRYATGEETRLALLEAITSQTDPALTPPTGSIPPRRSPSTKTLVANIPGQPMINISHDVTPPQKGTRKVLTRASRLTKVLAALALFMGSAIVFVLARETDSTVPLTVPSLGEQTALPPVQISRIVSFDPNGDDAQENDAEIWALQDGDVKTAWKTECYANQYFGQKKYVGVLIELSRATTGLLQVEMKNGPWSLEMYSATDSAPSQLDRWGTRISTDYNTRKGVSQMVVANPAKYVLLVFREVGKSVLCSTSNPYQGVVQEVSFSQT